MSDSSPVSEQISQGGQGDSAGQSVQGNSVARGHSVVPKADKSERTDIQPDASADSAHYVVQRYSRRATVEELLTLLQGLDNVAKQYQSHTS